MDSQQIQELEGVIGGYLAREISGGRSREIDRDDDLFASGRVDSVGIMRLIAHLESTLSVQIPPTDLVPENFRTIGVMAAYLSQLLDQ